MKATFNGEVFHTSMGEFKLFGEVSFDDGALDFSNATLQYRTNLTGNWQNIRTDSISETLSSKRLSCHGYRTHCIIDYVRWEVQLRNGFTNPDGQSPFVLDEQTGFHIPYCFYNEDLNCDDDFVTYYHDQAYYKWDCSQVTFVEDGSEYYDRVPNEILHASTTRHCSNCDRYFIDADDDDWDFENDCCSRCSAEVLRQRNRELIEGYCDSHEHEPIFFGEFKRDKGFAGLGFELEVEPRDECDDSRYAVAAGLIKECGLDEKEVRYAEDGSLNDNGFEIISQPHTVDEFWKKQNCWAKMLEYLRNNDYRSHDGGHCGLHVHVSRLMFGDKERKQNDAISKVYTFFDLNWDNLVKISRRKSFDYCNRSRVDCYIDTEKVKGSQLNKWKKAIANHGRSLGSHGVALNNRNTNTFEYRLGRGTLNKLSFFAWIDLIITITNNAKRITDKKVRTNDVVSWLAGIRESTARYIYKRGAFVDDIKALFPQVTWEENNESED